MGLEGGSSNPKERPSRRDFLRMMVGAGAAAIGAGMGPAKAQDSSPLRPEKRDIPTKPDPRAIPLPGESKEMWERRMIALDKNGGFGTQWISAVDGLYYELVISRAVIDGDHELVVARVWKWDADGAPKICDAYEVLKKF